MGIKQVKSGAFDQLSLLVHVKRSTCATFGIKNKMGLKQVKSDAFDELLLLVHV